MDDQMDQKQDSFGFIKAHWKVIAGVGLFVLLMIGAIFGKNQFKQTIESLRDQVTSLTQEKSILEKQMAEVKTENSTLKEQVNKERSKSKYLKEYYENGNLKSESGETSASSEARLTEMAQANSTLRQENEILRTDKQALQSELKTSYSRETIKNGAFGFGLGVNWKAEPTASLQANILGPVGIEGMASAGLAPFGLSGGAALVTFRP